MAHDFRMHRRVEFAETDMAGILHFANYFRYMEEAEHAFFRSLGLRVHEAPSAPGADTIGWVRVQTACEFLAPLRYEDVVELHLRVREKRRKALTYEVAFRKPRAAGAPQLVARGTMTVVCVVLGAPGSNAELRSREMPAAIAAAIEVAPGEPPVG